MKRYIDKDALVAEIERQISAIDNYPKLTDTLNIQIAVLKGNKVVLTKLLSFLDTIEVKEVDLEKELKTLDDMLFDLDGVAVKGATSYLTVNDVKDIAKRFFELGLKAQKGE